MYVQPLTLPPVAEDPEEARALVEHLLKAPVYCRGLTRVLQVDFTRNEACSGAYIQEINRQVLARDWHGIGWYLSFIGAPFTDQEFLDGPSIP